MRRSCPIHRRHSARGLSLLESVVSTVLVAVMLTAAIHTLGVARGGQQSVYDYRMGHQLAEQLMNEIISLPYADETVLDTLRQQVLVENRSVDMELGPEADEISTNRSLYDDIDDYDGWSSSPPTLRDGTSIDQASMYTRSVVIEQLSRSDTGVLAPIETGVRRVTVTVLRDGAKIAQLVRIVTLSPMPTQACVLPDGLCLDLPTDVCAALGGTALGPGTTALLDGYVGTFDSSSSTPLAHWTFDEGMGTLVADSADSHDGTLVGGTWIVGRIDKALAFAGTPSTPEYVEIPDDSTLDLTDQFTITGWVKSQSSPYEYPMICKGWADQNAYWLGLTTDLELEFRYVASGVSYSVRSGLFVTADSWSFVAASVDGGTVMFYLDGGTSIRTKEFSLEQNDLPLTIGRGVDSSQLFHGGIDDVRIYSEVLTTTFLDTLRSEGRSNPTPLSAADTTNSTAIAWLRMTRILPATGMSLFDAAGESRPAACSWSRSQEYRTAALTQGGL